MTTLTKISPPRASDAVPRERAFRLLDECMRRPAVWVASPAGSGKTTLVSSYLQARGIPCLWYQTDSGDSDIATFFYYLGLAAKKAAPRFRKPLPLLTPEYRMGIPVFARRYFEELYKRLKPPFAIVLDNYQEVPAGSPLHEIISIGLSCVPEGIRVVVVSRDAIPSKFARLRANNEMKSLGWDEVRLTREETGEIARANSGRRLDDKTLSVLYEKTEGWVAGLVLLMERSKGRSGGLLPPEACSPDEAFRYFASEIFDKMDRETRNFLLLTSFLPAISAPMAEALTGVKTAGRILKGLHEHNYFTERRLGEGSIYSYHALFRDFLRARAAEELTGEEVSEIQRRAAAVLMESGQVEDAAALLIDAGDGDELVPFVISSAHSLMSQGRSKTLEGWLAAIPKEIAAHQPWVLYWLGACRLWVSPAQSRGFFERAFHLFESARDAAGTFSAWAGAVDTFFFEFGDFRLLDRWIGWLDARMRQGVSFPSAEVEARVAASMTGALIWRMPDHPDIKKWVNASLSLLQEEISAEGRIRAYINIIAYYLWMGEFTECSLVVDRVRKMASTGPPSPMSEITSIVAEALLLRTFIDSSEDLLKMVTSGLQKADRSGMHMMDLSLLSLGVYSCLNADNAALAGTYLSGIEKVSESGRPAGSSLFLHQSAWAALLARDAQRAVTLAAKAVQLAEETGILLPEAIGRVVLALSMCEAGDHVEAGLQLERVRGIAVRTGSTYLEYLHHTAQAHCAFRRDDRGRALEALRRAMELGRGKGYTSVATFLRPDSMSRLCAEALEADIEVGYVQEIIRRLHLVPDGASKDLERWPWPIRIYTLGRFALLSDAETSGDSGKAQKKPLLLLKALIALGGRDIREEDLADTLWPEAEGDSGHNVFTTTLFRLRKMLGNDRAVLLSRGRVSINDQICWVDVWAFERLCKRAEILAERMPGGTRPKELRQIAAKAACLYAGLFLQTDPDKAWAITTRERLKGRYLRLISHMARLCEQAGEYEESAGYYHKGLESDPLAEELYQGLMASCIRLGRHAEALTAYRRCRDVLKAELGIAPSPRTEALREEARNSACA
jgi:DNA-binding SARP family transcriptional activator